MPFMRYACARITRPHVRDWGRTRVASGKTSVETSSNLVEQASKILDADFDPDKYLLTHATIVASVDTMPGPTKKTSAENGKKIVRKTSNYRIKPECDQYINNNLDSWARPVLLKSYKTFIGAHSFVEHVQIENLSKGRIIDAVARDIGDSIYVDILVANDRKHEDLCRRIESGELSTLSMGCSIDGSTCTKCGHWAADETEFCDHIRYEKGNTFFDENGIKMRIAELCGDESLDPTAGVTFVEGSWVEVPAFTGAVSRGVVSLAKAAKKRAAERLEQIFSGPAPTSSPDAMKKAARLGGFGDDEGGGDEAPAEAKTPAKPGSPFEGVEKEIKDLVVDKVRDDLKEEMSKKKIEEQVLPPSDAPNDTIIKQAARRGMRTAYLASLRSIVATAPTDVDLINRIAALNLEIGISIPVSLYRVALKVGARDLYRDLPHFLKAAGTALGRKVSVREAGTIIRLATLLEEQKKKASRRSAEQRTSKER